MTLHGKTLPCLSGSKNVRDLMSPYTIRAGVLAKQLWVRCLISCLVTWTSCGIRIFSCGRN